MFIFDDKPYTFDRVVRLLLALLFAWAGIRLLGYLSDVLIPFAVAVLLAYILHPLVLVIQKKVRHRGSAVLLALVLVLAAIILALSLLVPLIVKEFENMGPMLRKLGQSAWAQKVERHIPADFWTQCKAYARSPELQQFFQDETFWRLLEQGWHKVLPGVWGMLEGAKSVVLGLVGFLVTIVYLVFLLIDFRHFQSSWAGYIPEKYRDNTVGFLHDFNTYMKQYFRGQSAIAGLVGLMFAFGFWLIGLPMGILLGLFIGLLNMVPYLQIIGLIPAFLLALVYGLSDGTQVWTMLILTGVVFAVVQLIQDYILTPRIMGKATGLSPVAIILSISVWGKLLGFLGLLLAIPMTCLVLAYYRRYIVPSTQPPAT